MNYNRTLIVGNDCSYVDIYKYYLMKIQSYYDNLTYFLPSVIFYTLKLQKIYESLMKFFVRSYDYSTNNQFHPF